MLKQTFFKTILLLIVLATTAVACTTPTPTQTFSNPDFALQFDYPEDWQAELIDEVVGATNDNTDPFVVLTSDNGSITIHAPQTEAGKDALFSSMPAGNLDITNFPNTDLRTINGHEVSWHVMPYNSDDGGTAHQILLMIDEDLIWLATYGYPRTKASTFDPILETIVESMTMDTAVSTSP